MSDYFITSGRSSGYPEKHFGGHFAGSRATFCEPSDLESPSETVLSIPNTPVSVLTAFPISVQEGFFGIHVNNRANDEVTGVTAKTVRSHDMAGGKGRWKYIETSDNVWDFTHLDAWVNAHAAAGRDLIFTLFGTPTWASARPSEVGAYGPGNLGIQAEPADMAKWDRFCTKIAERYRGKIKYYEVWNEPNQHNNGTSAIPGTTFFFSGTFAKLAEMVRRASQAIKAVDPTAKIICPAVTNWSAKASQSAETYFTGMMAAATGDGVTTMKDWVDIIGVHLYLTTGNSTSALAGIIDRINAAKTAAGASSMETWDTESAPIGPSADSLSDELFKRYLTRFMITLAAKGVARTVYYQFDNLMGFRDRPAVNSHWNVIRRLLLDGSIVSASRLFDGRLIYRINTEIIVV